jgi:CO dehydrogenase/acetyl-CoA synthase beta subunit
MRLFEPHIDRIREFQKGHQKDGKLRTSMHAGPVKWPPSNRKNLVLAADTAVELGHPGDVSTSFLLWTNTPNRLNDQQITVIGPDLPELENQRASFGRIVLAAGTDFTEENSFDRYREMDLLRYDIDLKGYMMRGVSQYHREWSRVSRDALKNGFSFTVLGGAVLDMVKRLPYISAAEVIFVTLSRQAVLEIKSIADHAIQIVRAMNKMVEELSLDCSTCEYNAVCSDVADLRSMRNALKRQKAAVNV